MQIPNISYIAYFVIGIPTIFLSRQFFHCIFYFQIELYLLKSKKTDSEKVLKRMEYYIPIYKIYWFFFVPYIF